MTRPDGFERVTIDSADALWDWLGAHYAQPSAVWVVTWKKQLADKYVSTGEVLDALLAHGWVDGRRMKLDEDRVMQLIAPRKTQAWAQTYKDRVARLTEEGRMHQAGLACVAAGKASGLWDFMADVDAGIVPEDLAAALAQLPPAARHFEGFSPSSTRNILRWVKLAKTDATREKRIAEVARLAAQNRKPPQM